MQLTPKTYYWTGAGLALGALALLVLGSGALGIIGAGEADEVYLAVPAVALLGSLVARLRASGMALAMLATAAAQVLAPVVAFAAGMAGTEEASVVDVVGLTAMFAVLFLVASWLFGRASARG